MLPALSSAIASLSLLTLAVLFSTASASDARLWILDQREKHFIEHGASKVDTGAETSKSHAAEHIPWTGLPQKSIDLTGKFRRHYSEYQAHLSQDLIMRHTENETSEEEGSRRSLTAFAEQTSWTTNLRQTKILNEFVSKLATHNQGKVKDSASILPNIRRGLKSSFIGNSPIAGSSSAGMQTCMQAKASEEAASSNLDHPVTCSCDSTGISGQIMLRCLEDGCESCSKDGDVCFLHEYGAGFHATGTQMMYSETITYTRGLSQKLTLNYQGDSCTVTVDSQSCSSCEIVTCPRTGATGLKIGCAELPGGIDFDSCDDDDINTDGFFQVYNTGDFQTCLPSTPALHYCLEDASSEPLGEDYSCACKPDPAVPGGYVNNCMRLCTTCNGDSTLCGFDSLDYYYMPQDDQATAFGRTFVYSDGRSGVFEYRQRDRFTCDVSLNGEKCSRCFLSRCANGETSPFFDCSNLGIDDPNLKIDLCTDSPRPGSLFEFLELENCVERGMRACESDRVAFETQADPARAYECSCSSREDDLYELECIEGCGVKCNDERTVCGRDSIKNLYKPNGEFHSFVAEFNYEKGRSDKLSYQVFDDNSCSFSANGEQCDDCEIRSCRGSSRTAAVFDCRNIEVDAVIDSCDGDRLSMDGIFEALSGSEFDKCIDASPSNDDCTGSVLIDLTNDPVVMLSDSTVEAKPDGFKDTCIDAPESTSPSMWYAVIGTGSTITVSTCGEDTSFDTAISVYSGDCDGPMECVASNDDSCGTRSRVSWESEVGVAYHVRVFGYGDESGSYALSVRDGAADPGPCQEYADSREMSTDPALGTNCECAEDSLGRSRLTCHNDCEYCADDDEEVCAKASHGILFGSDGSIIAAADFFRYNEGREEFVLIEQTDCNNELKCETCEASIDNEECDGCLILDCGDGEVGYQLNCENIERGAFVDTCNTSPSSSLSSGVLQYFHPSGFNECRRDPDDVCRDVADKTQRDDKTLSTSCSCTPNDDGASTMSCVTPNCLFCNSKATDCGIKTTGALFAPETGLKIYDFVQTQYTRGRDESVLFRLGTDDTCSVTVNDGVCGSCVRKTCDATGREGIEVRCGLHGSYDSCDTSTHKGIFAVLNEHEFSTCLDPDKTAKDSCEELAASIESIEDMDDECECTKNQLTGEYLLYCAPASCVLCDDSSEVCGKNAHGGVLANYGRIVSEFQGFQYTSGRDEAVMFETLSVPSTGEEECRVRVDGFECRSCSVISCGPASNGSALQGRSDSDPQLRLATGMMVDCGNLDGGAVFDTCEETTMTIQEGIFQFLSSSEFSTCVEGKERPPVGDSNPPQSSPVDMRPAATPPPTSEPTSPPSEQPILPFNGVQDASHANTRSAFSGFLPIIFSLFLFAV